MTQGKQTCSSHSTGWKVIFFSISSFIYFMMFIIFVKRIGNLSTTLYLIFSETPYRWEVELKNWLAVFSVASIRWRIRVNGYNIIYLIIFCFMFKFCLVYMADVVGKLIFYKILHIKLYSCAIPFVSDRIQFYNEMWIVKKKRFFFFLLKSLGCVKEVNLAFGFKVFVYLLRVRFSYEWKAQRCVLTFLGV